MNILKFEYLLLLLGCYSLPFLYTIIHKRVLSKIGFYFINPTVLLAGIPFYLFDIWAKHNNLWQFNFKYMTGIKLFELPIEEILFFALIPQSCLLIWVALKHHSSKNQIKNLYNRHLKRFSKIL